jgi:cell wall-associated NlpC family hydrolase
MHWAVKYVGIPQMVGGRTSAGVDCWGLLKLVYQNEFNIELPDYPGVTAQSVLDIHLTIVEAAKQEWEEILVPVDGCAVAMSQKRIIHHVGIYLNIDQGKILHCWHKHNVIVDTLFALRMKGIKTLKYYRHHGFHHRDSQSV